MKIMSFNINKNVAIQITVGVASALLLGVGVTEVATRATTGSWRLSCIGPHHAAEKFVKDEEMDELSRGSVKKFLANPNGGKLDIVTMSDKELEEYKSDNGSHSFASVTQIEQLEPGKRYYLIWIENNKGSAVESYKNFIKYSSECLAENSSVSKQLPSPASGSTSTPDMSTGASESPKSPPISGIIPQADGAFGGRSTPESEVVADDAQPSSTDKSSTIEESSSGAKVNYTYAFKKLDLEKPAQRREMLQEWIQDHQTWIRSKFSSTKESVNFKMILGLYLSPINGSRIVFDESKNTLDMHDDTTVKYDENVWSESDEAVAKALVYVERLYIDDLCDQYKLAQKGGDGATTTLEIFNRYINGKIKHGSAVREYVKATREGQYLKVDKARIFTLTERVRKNESEKAVDKFVEYLIKRYAEKVVSQQQ